MKKSKLQKDIDNTISDFCALSVIWVFWFIIIYFMT